MATVDLTAETFTKTIEDNDLVIVDFWASWCNPCMRFAPIFTKVSEQHPEVVFGKVDTEAERELAGQLEIQAIPTLMAFHQGKLVFNQAGALNPQQFTQVVEALKAFDPEQAAAQQQG